MLGCKGGEKIAIKKISKKQIIKVRFNSSRSINFMNHSLKKKYSINLTKSRKNSPTSLNFIKLNQTTTIYISYSNTVQVELYKNSSSVSKTLCRWSYWWYSDKKNCCKNPIDPGKVTFSWNNTSGSEGKNVIIKPSNFLLT